MSSNFPMHSEIRGPTPRCCVSAKTLIDVLLIDSRSRIPPTHFVCIPVTLDKRLTELYQTLNKGYAIDSSYFLPIEKLHVTLQVALLLTDEEVVAATECISESVRSFRLTFEEDSAIQAHGRSMNGANIASVLANNKLSFRGLEIMNDDPRDANVVYLKLVASPLAAHLERLAGSWYIFLSCCVFLPMINRHDNTSAGTSRAVGCKDSITIYQATRYFVEHQVCECIPRFPEVASTGLSSSTAERN